MNSLAAELDAVRLAIATQSPEPSPQDEPAGKTQTEIIPKTPQNETPPEPTQARGLTNADLAEQTGIPKSTIERWKAKIQRGESLSKIKNPIVSKLDLDSDGLWYLRE